MCDHGHSHGAGGGGCSSEVSEVIHADEGIEYNMNSLIDKDKVTVLNESIDGSGVRVFKDWREHLDNHGAGGGCSSEVSEVIHADEGIEYNMNSLIDKDKVTVLNESIDGSGVRVFKDWREHLDKTFYVESDVDEELLFNIPFTGHVKLTGITIMGDLNDTHPSRIRIFKDRESMSFSDIEGAKPDQEMQLKQDDEAKIDYPLIVTKFGNVHHLTLHFPSNFGGDETRIYYIAKIDYPLIVTKFGNVHHLTLHFPSNFGGNETRIYYIGLRGSFQHALRDQIVIATYEARPVPDDHKHSIPNANSYDVC
uniref:PITH domain-containing protein n=1 Tax=Panagrolaimus sp. PS1159 TaxID=55785 RepID=A0AC35F9S4_9BILA